LVAAGAGAEAAGAGAKAAGVAEEADSEDLAAARVVEEEPGGVGEVSPRDDFADSVRN